MSNLDFISRSELLAEIDRERKRHIDSGNYGAEHLMVHSMRRLVEEAPAVDAVQCDFERLEKTKFPTLTVNPLRCGACGAEFAVLFKDVPGKIGFCPNCGAARMDKEE